MKRPHVVALIAAGTAYRLTLVIAPAGSGKSRALNEFLATVERPYRFFDAVAGGDVRAWLEDGEAFEGVLAIDGLDRLERSEISAVVAAVDRARETQRWIVASRSTVGLPVGTWLAYARAGAPIAGDDLDFSPAEARHDVLAFTGGWAVATAFARRLAGRAGELRTVRERTREMMRSFLDENFYAALSHAERELLEVACVLPAMDVDVLERAGFADAGEAMRCIAARTGMIRETENGRFACRDIVVGFLRWKMSARDREPRLALFERAAAALESSGAIGEALDAYVAAERRDRIVGLLRERGLHLLDRAHVDAVRRAIEALDDKTKREDSAILTLRGVAHAAKGRQVRAEGLFRRALARANNDKPVHAAATLRLSLLLANRGDDVGDHLEPLATDGGHAAEARAEAWSLLAAQRALAGDASAARAAVERVTELLPSVEGDDVRAKVLQRIGVAAINNGDVEHARSSLQEAAELATELELYSLASRAYATLFNLVRHHHDDVKEQELFSAGALHAAEMSGDPFDLKSALIQSLNVAMRLGKADVVEVLEERLDRLPDNGHRPFVSAPFKAVRFAWSGNFADASRLMAHALGRIHFRTDYLTCSALLAVFLECDGRSDSAKRVLNDLTRALATFNGDRLFERRQKCVVLLCCSVVHAMSRRLTFAEKTLAKIPQDDAVEKKLFDAGRGMLDLIRHSGTSSSTDISNHVHGLADLGYADVANVLKAASLVIRSRNNVEPAELSPAEVSVLCMLNEGLGTKEIAGRLGRSVYTIRAHIANAISKLGCHGRGEATAAARRLGIID